MARSKNKRNILAREVYNFAEQLHTMEEFLFRNITSHHKIWVVHKYELIRGHSNSRNVSIFKAILRKSVART